MENIDQLLGVLKCVSCQDSSTGTIAQATQYLENNESTEGFHFSLLKIGLSQELSANVTVRWHAVLYLKNSVEKHWRSHSPAPICDAEKSSIRNEILSCFSESVPQIALQFAVIVSKIARYDYPKNWPQLIHILIPSVGTLDPSSLQLRDNTILLTCHYVMKELSSKRLPNDQEIFSQVSAGIFLPCFQTWEKLHKTVIDNLQIYASNTNSGLLYFIQKLNSILKVLRCVSPVLDSDKRKQLFRHVITGLQTLLALCHLPSQNWGSVNDSFHKLLIMHTKILLDALEWNNDDTISEFCKEILSLSKKCMFAYSENKSLFAERFVVNCMNMMKAILSTFYEDVAAILLDGMQDFLSCLVFSFLPLTHLDLESWEDDVEEFCSEEIGETWKYNLRPSTEVLFLTFLHYNTQQLVPVILSTLETVNKNLARDDLQAAMDMKSILTADAVFTATGLACNELFDALDFEVWFTTTLLPCIQKCVGHPSGKIIHRRVLWLVGQWMGVKPPVNIRTTIFDFLISSLHGSFNIAVRLAAASALRLVLDDFDLDITSFKPYQERCADGLYALLRHVQTADAKRRVLHVFSFVIERLGSQMSSSLRKLTEMLPSIWHASEVDNMLRCAVVTTLVNAVVGLKGNSVSLQPFLLKVIHTCTDISSPAHVYLLPDGLDLWLTVLHNTNEISENLLQLFNNISGLLELSSESIRQTLDIVECYALLGGEAFIGGRHGSVLVKAISSLITDVRDECLVMVTRLVETLIKIAPKETPFVFQQYLQDTLQCVFSDNQVSILSTARLLLISRLIFENVTAFWSLFSQNAGENGLQEAILTFFKIVSERIDGVVETKQRKVVALACLSLLNRFAAGQPLHNALQHVICICIQVLYDVCDEEHVDTVVISDSAGGLKAEEWDDFHALRTRSLIHSDLNHKLSLPHCVRKTLDSMAINCGGPEDFESILLTSVGKETLEELQKFL